MWGVIFSCALSLAICNLSSKIFRKLLVDLDPALQFGLSGLIGLGLLGTLTLFVGLIPGGFHWGFWAILCPILLIGILYPRKIRPLKFRVDLKPFELLALAVVSVGFLFALIGVLVPSTANDWDSIAYHMAVPKIYLALGEIHRIVYIHHSNFPSAIELLFVWTLRFGQSGAKMILWFFTFFGSCTVFGFARQRYGRAAAWWATLAFFSVPTVIWETGTAYIDVAHGLFGALGFAILASELERSHANQSKLEMSKVILGGILLGLSCGTKYTGLETSAIALLVLGICAIRLKQNLMLKPLLQCALVAFVVGGSWYVKNIVLVSNPVYPFAFETFGGKNWDEKRSLIYRQEQLSFGVGVSPQGKNWADLGHAILGLAYQPGRYVNPLETVGGGSPLGAVGIPFFAGLLIWGLIKRPNKFEAQVLGFSLISLILWFGLSQQSRYLTDLVPVAAILVGGAISTIVWGRVIAAVIILQSGYSLWLEKQVTVNPGLPVVLGQESDKDFLHQNLPFSDAATDINELPQTSKVALYDQVFGYYLDVPYFWANPPHCTIVPYSTLHSGRDYAQEMSKLGFTNIYVQFVDPSTDRDFAQAIGIAGYPTPLPPNLQQKWTSNWIQQWKPLLADAVERGDIVPVKSYPFGMLFKIISANR